MRYILISSILWLSSTTARAQTDSVQTEKKKTTFTIGATYASNASYYGQKAAEPMPYVALSGSIRFPAGIYFTGTGLRLLNDSGSVVSASAAGAGIAFNLGKKVTADLSYSHTFYPSNSPFLQAANPDNASATLSYEYWMTTGINVDYAFGKQQDAFVTLSTEKQIHLGSFAKGKDLVTLTPTLEVTGGTQHFYETYVKGKRFRDSVLGLPLPLPPGLPGTGTTTTRSNTSFDLLSWNFKVPLAYNRAHYMIEASYQLSLLSEKARTGAGDVNSFFNFSIYYQF